MKQWDFRHETIGEIEQLILDLHADTEMDYFALNMLSHNEMVHIIPVQLMRVNNSYNMQFQITNLKLMKKRLVSGIFKKNALTILNSILNAFEEAESYMLDPGKLYLNENYVYLDSQDECHMVYIPLEETEPMDVLLFLKRTIENIQPDYTEKDPYLYDILNAFNRGGIRKLSDLRELLKKCESTDKQGGASDIYVPPVQTPVSKEPDYVFKSREKEIKPEEEKQVSGSEKKSIFHVALKKDKEHKNEKNKPLITVKGKKDKAIAPAKIPVMNIPGKTDYCMKPSSVALDIPNHTKPKEDTAHEVNGYDESGLSQQPSKKGFPINIPFSSKDKKKENGVFTPFQIGQAEYSQPITQERNRDGEMYESYEATVLMEDVEFKEDSYTVQLEQSGEAQLIHMQDNNIFVLSEGNNTFGSGENVKYQIQGNKAVSRMHATIRKQGGSYYLIDHGSTNGSFLDGKRISKGMMEKIYDGAVIRFADEEFQFKMF
ncbi:MAG: FHA domain-containing protein [Lachnospiraceae bacterium]|nr:FHA domain-containing protein [Lachnospiraceae bacterium]